MARHTFALLTLLVTAALVAASPAPAKRSNNTPLVNTPVTLNGVTFVNKGLVGFGRIPSNFVESTGDSLGGLGSSIAIKPGSFVKNSDASYSGTLITQPDRGYNIEGTIDYQGRQHTIDFVLTPYYSDTKLSFTDAQKTLALTYKSTLRYTERSNVPTTGLDALTSRSAMASFPADPLADPQVPIPSTSYNRLALDLEGLVLNPDGSFWISDEYGPYIYLFSAKGQLIQSIQPPQAILPKDSSGKLTFTSDDDPATGRGSNQGFENLTLDPSRNILYAMLQSALIQDGGDDKSTSRFTRLLAYDVSNPTTVRPTLVGEWVVPLPLSDKGNTQAASEIKFVGQNMFLVLSRDGDGLGGDDNNSKYRQADLIDISKATNIAGSKFDQSNSPIAKSGKLDSSITPATYTGFVNFIDTTQLARFGLHNGKPADSTLLAAKWESLALAPVGDSANPHDFFLFTASDNDFLSTHGVFDGTKFNGGLDVDNQFLVFRVTLPNAPVVVN